MAQQGRRATRLTRAQKNVVFNFMNENPRLARDPTDLTMRLSSDEKVRLWHELTECLNALGPPTNTFRGWMAAWSRRVMKAQRKAEQLAEEYRQASGGPGGRARVRPLSSSHAWILTLVGDDSAYRTPTGFRCRTYKDEDDQQKKPASLPEQDQRDTAASEDAGPRVSRATPQRARHNEASLETVVRALRQTAEQCARQHREKMASAAQERELQGQLLHRMRDLTDAMQEATSERQNTNRILQGLRNLLTSRLGYPSN
ncbi:uncharacterized protein LOC121047488 [Ixodes scapularis]|uniref:uncharacterized protein LOC121047488 n=1 Tax=Ixodes scapularis TaxID=6945 RepID=UPI001C38ABEC|nr:uncharacterized protein LOC121047488 [Ixodes scapularis]